MADTLDRTAVREWLVRALDLAAGDPRNIITVFDSRFPPPAPPLPRCHWCGGEQVQPRGEFFFRCKQCERRWPWPAGVKTLPAAIAAYERPLRLAEARGRVEGAIRASGVDPQSAVDHYRAELAALEAQKS